MRTRVRVIFTLWLEIGSALCASAAYYWLPDGWNFFFIFAVGLASMIAFYAIWRTQPTFRRLAHWFSAGVWPRDLS